MKEQDRHRSLVSKLMLGGYAVSILILAYFGFQAYLNPIEVESLKWYIFMVVVVVGVYLRWQYIDKVAAETLKRTYQPDTHSQVIGHVYVSRALVTLLPLIMSGIGWSKPTPTHSDVLMVMLGCVTAFAISQVILDVMSSLPSEAPPKPPAPPSPQE
jgi:Zn-dependent protease